jgi:DNA-binding transcriptional regulator YiaG
MIAVDIDYLENQQNDPAMWGQYGLLASPPAIVQTVEDSWNHGNLNEVYRYELEIIFEEENTDTQVAHYVSENGEVVAVDQDTAGLANGNPLPEKLDTIKTRLGIGMKHLAAALGVERPTVYAWTKGERQPQPKRWERIHSLLELADYWQELSRHPLSRRIFVPMESGQSAMDLLSVDTLDVPLIKKGFTSLATDENDRSARLRDKAVAMRERMKAKGAKPLPNEVVEQSMRNLSD